MNDIQLKMMMLELVLKYKPDDKNPIETAEAFFKFIKEVPSILPVKGVIVAQ